MAVLFELRDACKNYGPQVLLDHTDVVLQDHHKVGLIGRNGAGKSTLCRILLGQEELDGGELIRHPRLNVGYLQQHDPFEPGETVLDFLLRDSGQPDWKCGEVAAQFSLKGPALDTPVRQLSGGWQTRVKLASLLLHEPSLLVLDEPTNFLDIRTQMLLEEFLKGFRAGLLVVSHDRSFLNAVCDHTLDLTRGKLSFYPGNVDTFLQNVAEQKQHDERANAAIAAKMRQLETFINKNRANANTASQARSKQKELDRLELKDIAASESVVRISFPPVNARQGTAVRVTDAAIGYPDHVVARDIRVEIEHRTRVAIVGDNGEGKTTFLRTLVGSLELHSGTLKWGHGCEIGTYAQHVYTTLPADWTVKQYLDSEAAFGVTQQQILDTAGSFLFRGEAVQKRIGVLSGGERARLCLAGLLLSDKNVLILDEPGNHLDVETVEALVVALKAYPGTVIFTSHDRHFMQALATDVIEVRGGRVAAYPGSYETYLYRIRKETEDGQRQLTLKVSPKNATDAPPAAAPAARAGSREDKKLRRQLSETEKRIAQLDSRRKELSAEFGNTTSPADAQRIHRELTTVSEEITGLEERWFEINAELEAG